MKASACVKNTLICYITIELTLCNLEIFYFIYEN